MNVGGCEVAGMIAGFAARFEVRRSFGLDLFGFQQCDGHDPFSRRRVPVHRGIPGMPQSNVQFTVATVFRSAFALITVPGEIFCIQPRVRLPTGAEYNQGRITEASRIVVVTYN